MDSKYVCRLCLVSKNKIIEFFSDEGIASNISTILDQHFWFQIHQDDNLPMGICRICWKYVNDFHGFYKNIELIHKNHYDNIQIKTDPTIPNIKLEKEDNYSLSFCHSNIDLVEPTVEIKIEHDETTSGKTKRNIPSNTDLVEPPVEIKIEHVKTVSGKTKRNKGLENDFVITSKLLKTKTVSKNENADNQQRNTTITTIKKQKQIVDENSIIVNNNISDGNQIRDELIDLSTDSIENNDVLENRKVVKKLDNPLRVAEDIQIREFYNLKCEICSSKHSTILEIRKHYLDVHKCKSGYVLCCNKKLFKRCQLLEHMIWHTNPNKFKCKVCNKMFGDKYCLKNHMHFHSKPEERGYICDICQASFTVRYHLMRHFRKVHRTQTKQEFKCNQCDKIFNKNSLLQSHIRGVHEFKNVTICQICAKVYKSKSQCQIHYLEEHINMNKPKLKCNLCNVLLKNETSLKCHMRRIHFAEPSECKLCGKITPNKNSLQNHIRNVHAERTHKCILCEKVFKTSKRLKEHTATHSGKSILYSCPYCTTAFNSQSNMHSHRKKKHPVEWLDDRQKRLGITTVNNYYK